MFCPKCGKELNTNNVCVNPSCPSHINNNNSINQGYESTNQNTQGYNQNPQQQYVNQNFNGNYGFNQNNQYHPNQNTQNFNNSQFGENNDFRDQNGISSAEMMEFIGYKNSDYYIDKWGKSQENKNFISWNWPAFFTNFLWFWHRKMYGIAAGIFGVNFIIRLFIASTSATLTGHNFNIASRTTNWFGIILNILVGVLSSLFANQLYMKHATNKIRSIKSTSYMGFDNNTIFNRLRKSGGTTWAPLIFVIVVFVVIFIFALIAISFGSSHYRYSHFY
ncbi:MULTISPECIES: DUF2628 domain-containing protein [Clostridium]|uniref:DUF2628 domain-containing protein n=1 Tax=Clostridium cibarium TaxID=2762247 RepID=A0ABR8PUK9_9CLOT|nr:MULTISPECIES: DUF2628 domain-containing protein [Clostridium]MBD7911813.1 DUF2628 domain-containing protein [Clostridium cibarium]